MSDNTMEWMKSKSIITKTAMEIDGVQYMKTSYDFVGKLPYHMMKAVSSGFFEQNVFGSVESGDYVETCETMHRYGDKNPRGVYNFTEFRQISVALAK